MGKNKLERLLCNGVPQYAQIYDHGKNFQFRFTVLFTNIKPEIGMKFTETGRTEQSPAHDLSLADSRIKKTRYDCLPLPARQAILREYKEIWNI